MKFKVSLFSVCHKVSFSPSSQSEEKKNGLSYCKLQEAKTPVKPQLINWEPPRALWDRESQVLGKYIVLLALETDGIASLHDHWRLVGCGSGEFRWLLLPRVHWRPTRLFFKVQPLGIFQGTPKKEGKPPDLTPGGVMGLASCRHGLL